MAAKVNGTLQPVLSFDTGVAAISKQTLEKCRVLISVIANNSQSLSCGFRFPDLYNMKLIGNGCGVHVFALELSQQRNNVCVGSPCAIKIAKKRKDRSDYGLIAARLKYEADILKQLNHPNIIGYRGYGRPSPNTAFLVMEKATKSLEKLIEELPRRTFEMDTDELELLPPPFSAANVEKVALGVAQALSYLHEDIGMIHGDLKPANILIFGEFEIIKLCDFGVARKLTTAGIIEGEYFGTHGWTPMEVILDEKSMTKFPVLITRLKLNCNLKL